jgi:hypothetical protein
MLRYVTLCYVMLRYVTLCYVMLRYVRLCYRYNKVFINVFINVCINVFVSVFISLPNNISLCWRTKPLEGVVVAYNGIILQV